MIRLKQVASNVTLVTLGDIDLLFSYETIVAFRTYDTGWVRSENVWSRTTGKHLGQHVPASALTIHHDQFTDMVNRLTGAISAHD